MGLLYVRVCKENENVFLVDVTTYVTIFIYVLADCDVSLKVCFTEGRNDFIRVDFDGVKHEVVEGIPEIATYSSWPVIVAKNRVISGLCSMARYLIKLSKNESIRQLLGFREACLMSCAESSIWTRFCEIDILETIRDLCNNKVEETLILPVNLCRFEYHLQQPVRMHNMYKLARIKNKNPGISSSTPVENLNINHLYGEGPFMTLSDAILYPCFKIIFQLLPLDLIKYEIPNVFNWFNRMQENKLPNININLTIPPYNIIKVTQPQFTKHSLYTSDPNRYRPEKRIFTKQEDIEKAIKLVEKLTKKICNKLIPFGEEIPFDWQQIPLDANPLGGALPEKRADRKSEQLMNLAKAVMKVAGKNSYKIVDFCSGSGHLGILLAYLLPNCTIILVENKERSLQRAIERINALKLTNIQIVQSNLDYFVGKFDVGVALHACGVATDLVIQKCLDQSAHFIVCPCCYGGIKNCHHLTYPRSETFKSLNWNLKDYLTLGHAADQTHDSENEKTKQGYLCMDIVDTDRKWHAESFGYDVYLGKLKPETCTNKNNLLVGIFIEK